MTFNVMTLTRMTAETKLRTMSSSIMPLSKMTLNIMTISKMTLNRKNSAE